MRRLPGSSLDHYGSAAYICKCSGRELLFYETEISLPWQLHGYHSNMKTVF